MEELSVKEAADWLGRSERTVRWMVKEGKLQARRNGKSWRIAKSAVEAIAAPQVEAKRAQVEDARERINAALDSIAQPPGASPAKRFYSVTELRAWPIIVAALRQVHALGEQYPQHKPALKSVEAKLHDCASALADAAHQFHANLKVQRWLLVRTRICAALAEARLVGELYGMADLSLIGDVLERDALGGVRGLLRKAEARLQR